MQFKSIMTAGLAASLLAAASLPPAWGGGLAGSYQLAEVRAEGTFIALDPNPGNWSNPANCDDSSRALIGTSDALQDQKLGLAMTALGSGKKVLVYVNGCVMSPWGVTMPVISTLGLLAN